MFDRQPHRPLPPELVTDDATAWACALALRPTVGPSTAPATVTAQVRGQGLFVRVVVDEALPPCDRELLGELARSQIVRLLRDGTGDGGWTWDAASGAWTATVRADVSLVVPDHVPEEWTRAA
jgi:hypothetical protein